MNPESNHNFHEIDSPIRPTISIPRISVPNQFNRCLFFSGFTMLCINTCILLIMIITIGSEAKELTELLTDSQSTIADLQIIIPEIKDSLQILKDFCKMDEFSKYCYPQLGL